MDRRYWDGRPWRKKARKFSLDGGRRLSIVDLTDITFANFIAQPFVKRFALCYRTVACQSCL